MNDSPCKNLWVSDFPAITDIPANKDTVQIIKDAERAVNRMLENSAWAKRIPLEVKMMIHDNHGSPRRVMVTVLAAAEGDVETIKEFYERTKEPPLGV